MRLTPVGTALVRGVRDGWPVGASEAGAEDGPARSGLSCQNPNNQ